MLVKKKKTDAQKNFYYSIHIIFPELYYIKVVLNQMDRLLVNHSATYSTDILLVSHIGHIQHVLIETQWRSEVMAGDTGNVIKGLLCYILLPSANNPFSVGVVVTHSSHDTCTNENENWL